MQLFLTILKFSGWYMLGIIVMFVIVRLMYPTRKDRPMTVQMAIVWPFTGIGIIVSAVMLYSYKLWEGKP